jgi:transporter family-2 protein
MSFAVIYIVLSIIIVGATLAMQAPANAALARALGDPVAAAALSFGIGFIILTAIAVLRGAETPNFSALNSIPWWALSGGALGALWVLAAILAVPRLGVVTMFSAMILGQLIAALMIDAVGGFGLQPRDLNPTRLLAVGLVGAGVMLSNQ